MAGYDFRDYPDYDDYDDYSDKRCCGCRRKHTDSGSGPNMASSSDRTCFRKCSNSIQLLLLLLGVGAGVGLGILLRTIPPFDQPKLNPRSMWYLDFPAELFIRVMMLLSVPLMVSSIVSGVASMGGAGGVGLRAMSFYIGTTVLACAEGFGFVFLIRPGSNVPLQPVNDTEDENNKIDMGLDLLRNLMPDNIISPAFESAITKRDWSFPDIANYNISNGPLEVLTVGHRHGMNIMGLTLMSFVIGIAINNVGEKARPLADFFTAVFEVVMVIIKVIIWILPLGVIFMVAGTVVRLENPIEYLLSMVWFLITVIAGLSTHFFLTMPILLLALTRTNPLKHMLRMARAIGTALATNNSNMTLPVTMECLEKNCGYDRRIVRFMCPIGATINMDGTCLYEAIAVIFIATLRGVATGPAEIFTAGFTAIMLSIGAPAAGSGIVVWGILLNSIGLPLIDVFLIIPFDWMLGRLRTAVNIFGDSVGVAVICHFSKDALERLPPDNIDDTIQDDEDKVSELSMGMMMNGSYRPIESTPSRRKSYTLTVENESGDVVKVSKV